MKFLSVAEYEPIKIGDRFSAEDKVITRKQAAHLIKMEQEQRKSVFKWGYNNIIPQQWIGVTSVADLQIEILPKLSGGESPNLRKNLLYMLAVAREVPFRTRDIGQLDTQKNSFLECFITVFIEKVGYALKTGVIHQYNNMEGNSPFLKGKLLPSEQKKRNIYNNNRFYISYDEYSIQNIPNRILRATFGLLMGMTRLPGNKRALQLLSSYLDDVPTQGFSLSDFQRLRLPRTIHHTYKEIFEMCRIFWNHEAPNLSTGASGAFTILFDMNVIFERFISNLMEQHQAFLLDDTHSLITNQNAHIRYLVNNNRNRGVYKLIPDNCILNELEDRFERIIDTKWKLLNPNEANLGVSQQDIYQMYAYAREFNCGKITLLYPSNHISPSERFKLYNDTHLGHEFEISISSINLNYKFPEEIPYLLRDLKDIIH